MLTHSILLKFLNYDLETGIFTWNVSRQGNRGIGSTAGAQHSSGHIEIGVQGKVYKEHRLAWFYVTGDWPLNFVDHINGIRNDNRWVNIRDATNTENQWNSHPHKENKSGFKGVDYHKKNKKWRSSISIKGKRIYLGYFHTPEEASAAYEAAALELHGEFFYKYGQEAAE